MSAFKQDNLLKEARDTDIKLILAYYGTYANRNGLYHCIYHEDKTPSASVRLNRYKCFACGRKNSTLDIVMYKESISDPREAAARVLEIANKDIDIKILDENIKMNDNKKKKTLSFHDRIKLTNFENITKIEEYLRSRAIDPKVLKTLDTNDIRYGVDRLGQINFFFLKGQFAIYRSLTGKNFNCGTPSPVTIISDKQDYEWYITEGIFDALTLVSLGKNTICLNSVSNVDKLLKLININNKKFKYIIATDCDESGFNAMEKMSLFFEKNNLSFDIFDELYGSGCKDINEMRTKGLL